ncbi:autotransporter domain-containing protein [Arcobacter aquimarinus]|uniref:Autotransporter domain-containing protein n=6 Tax=Arcobacter aquimarinus TaxID=1315211 RepID=A0AAE7E186_9BACT|nr:autotransporter domain-containing protein [Arcobacter aquimarinus]QKE25672.1 autotransporter domain-containing protein [Arcobacter aquimarinus]
MNSFRVIDTRFRILKGGKIGLSLSISLIGSALVFGSVNSYAVDYFTDVQSTVSDSTTTPLGGTNPITVEKAVNGGSVNTTRIENDTNPVVFKPTSWANSSYTDPTFAAAETTPTVYPARYYLGKEDFVPLELNLTFASGASSGSISKNSTTFYSANITPPGYIADNPGIPTQTLTTVVSNNYKANLIFEGSNTVSGSTNIEDGNIKIDGSIDFNGTVTAGSIEVDTTDTATFGSNVSLSSGAGNLNFSQDGSIILNSNFSGNITNTNSGDGNITTVGINNINGNIGNSSNFLNSLSVGDLTTISTTTVNGDVFANSTVLNNTITNSSTLILSNDKNITSTITTSHDNKGILTLSGGTQTVTGQIGTDTLKLAEINAGANGSDSTFNSDVFATNLDVEGTGRVNLNGDYKGTSIRYNADGTVVLADGSDVNSSIINNSGVDSTGTLTLNGSSTVSGNVGADGASLKEINAGATGSNSTFNSDVFATNLDVEGTGRVNLNGDYKGTSIRYNADGTVVLADGSDVNSAITTGTTNTGTLTLNGSSTVSGNVGADGASLKEINAGATGSNSTFNSDVFATTTNVGAGEIKFEGNLTGNIDAITSNQGTITFVGDNSGKAQLVTGNIGIFGDSINVLNIGESGSLINYSTTTVNGDVFANSTVLNNTITNSSTLILSNDKNITSTITTSHDNKGILTLSGGTQTVTGQIGTDTLKLAEINAGANGSDSTFSSDVFATNLDVEGTGRVNLNGDYKGTSIRYNADGTVVLADNKNIDSSIINNSSTTPTGTLTLEGSSIVSGTVGTDVNRLKEINAGANGSDSTFNSDVFATNLDVEGTGRVNLNGDYKGTSIRYNADGTVVLADGSDVNSSIINNSGVDSTGTLTLNGSSTVSGNVGADGASLKEINAGATGSNSTFNSDVFATNLDVEGTGRVNLNGDYKGTSIRYNADGTVVLADGSDVNSAITTGTTNTGTLTLNGSSTVSGNVGADGASLKEINAGATGSNSTFNSDVFATTTNVGAGEIKFEGNLTGNIDAITSNQGTITFVGDNSGKAQLVTGNIGIFGDSINVLNIGESGSLINYSTTTVNGDVFANSTVLNNTITNSSTLILSNDKNITSTITTSHDNKGILTLSGGTQTVTGQIGTDTLKLAEINAGANGSDSTFSSDVFATNLDVEGTGRVNLNGDYKGTSIRYNADGTVVLADNKNIDSSIINSSSTTPTGTLTLNGSSIVSGTVGTDANRLKEINAGATGSDSTFSSDVFATTTNITSGVVNFNTISGTTTTNIVFSGNGTANLNQGLTGNIYFAGNDANINVSDGKGILGSVETLANNTGILNFKGDGVINGIIGSADFAIKELNVNSENEQDKDGNGTVITQGLLAHREIFAEIINLRNNATLTLANNANITKTSTGLVISTDSANSGNVVFLGSSTVTGEVGTNSNNLESITAGANNHTVTFNDMVYASIINYSDDGKVVLNGDNSLNSNAEGFKGTVNFNSKSGTLEIGDDVNITTGATEIQFTNAKNATLAFNGTSIIKGSLGSENGTNDTFKTINAGALNETVKFEDNIYVMDSLNLSSNGKVQIVDENYVKRNSNSATTGAIITTSTDGFGDLEYLGTTILYDDIGTSSKKLNNVTFASTGDASNIYNQDIDKNVYALNTTIGNSSNKTTLNIKEDITFGGNLNLRKDSVLNVSDYNVTVANNLDIASNSTLNFKVYTTDISAGQAVENGNSGSITAQSLNMANDAKIHIDYDGTWEGAGKYNLIKASSITTDYYGTEKNGLVSDNSIIDSIVTKDGTNLTLFADRTSGGSFNPEDLYIEKSEIGKDYSNGASQSLAGYANEKNREGALADIIREMEYFDGGTNLSEAKKQEMIKMQRLLTPTANNSNIQSTITATNLSASTIKGRLSDIRVTQENNFTPNTYDYLGLSSGDYYTFDTSFWLKAMASKATQDRIKEYDGFDTSTYGFVGGMDKITNDGTIFGVALSYSTTKTKQDGLRTDDSDTTSVQATLYSSQEIGDAYVDGYLSYGKHKTDATRTANSGKLNSSVNSDQISAKVETGYKIPLNDGISLTPFASLEYSLLNQKGYTEKGSTYQNDALKVDSIKLNRGTAELGAKLVTNIEFDDTLIIPQFSASVYNSFGDNKPDVKAQFVGGGNKFVTPVPDMNDTMFNLGLGVETKISDSTSLIFDVDYDRSKDGKFEAYSGSVTFGVSF